MVTGTTLGPVPTNQVDVKLKMKVQKEKNPLADDEAEEPEISSLDKGKIQLIMYGSKDLDISQLDLKSIRFGPGNASPVSTKVIDKSYRGWKRLPADDKKMLLMEFKLADLLIRCDLDHSLVLKATAGSKKVYGAVKMKPVICNSQIWKQMGLERKWPQTPEEH